jgi:pimeloyl-ACP methyl ester carboxylesterase
MKVASSIRDWLRVRTAASRGRALALLPPLLALLLFAGCSTPIGADKLPPRQAYRLANQTALNSSMCSGDTRLVLRRYDLDRQFAKNPAATLASLHAQATRDDRRDELFALAELNYCHADRLRHSVKPGESRRAPNYFFSAAIYAYLYLLGPGSQPPPGPFDRRFRVACDLYDRALAQGLRFGPATNAALTLAGGTRSLPQGKVDVRLVCPVFKWNFDEIEAFLPADEFNVRGLTVRDRQSGLGAPLIVVGKKLEPKRFPRRFPATVFLRVNGDLKAWSAGTLTASLELFSSFEESKVSVQEQAVPLATDLTAPLAWGLNNTQAWWLGSQQFFSAEEQIRSDIYFSQPYQPGLVPVVFVHGTFSSPIWWSEMWNTLRADPALRGRCQFWYFIYNSGNPISYSAARLRAALLRKVQQLDPEGKDPALRRMVVIGHSQGGLLTKLTVTDTADRLWRLVSNKDLDQLELSPDLRERLRTNFFFTRLPCVERAVFISTPHRGSYLANSLVRSVLGLFISLPKALLATPASLLQVRDPLNLPKEVSGTVPTSLDDMSPRNKWLLELAEIPPATGVKSHSIIAIRGNQPPPKGSDGVVKYTSAHVPYAESEFIVRGGHSCQDRPAAIEEVRRILLEHLAEMNRPPVPALPEVALP